MHQAQAISRVGSWHYEFATESLTVSDTLADLYELPHGTVLRDFSAMYELIAEADLAAFRAASHQLIATGRPMSVRYRVRRRVDGDVRWFHARGAVDQDAAGSAVGLIGSVADVTELVEAERDARSAHVQALQAQRHHQAIVAATPDAIHLFDMAAGRSRRANTAGPPLIGFTSEALQVMTDIDLHEVMSSDDVRALTILRSQACALPDGGVVEMTHAVRHLDGTHRWLSRRMTPFSRSAANAVEVLLVITRDVTKVVEEEQQLRRAAGYDDLTGLPNKRSLRQRVEDALDEMRLGGPRLVLLVCDLDGFKRVNNSFGHLTGDHMIVEIANRLIGAARPGDMVARLGGDEFAVALTVPDDCDVEHAAKLVASRITEALYAPIWVAEIEHTITVSVGIAVAADDASVESLLGDADTAMYFVKKHGANGHVVYQPGQRSDTGQLIHLEHLIRHALAEDTIDVYYQPIVDPRTNTLHSVEALLRVWDADQDRFANTDELVTVAEHTGMITAIDERVLDIACTQVAHWRRAPELAHLAPKVNRSAREIGRSGFDERVLRALERSGLDPRALTLELTETLLLDASTTTLSELRILHERGVGLAIDDFGTGYASLRYLAELPITCIKIDRSFTSKIPHDSTSMTLIGATAGLADQLDIDCIVEGVETPEQLLALSQHERLLIQGYLFSRPRPGAEPPPLHWIPPTT